MYEGEERIEKRRERKRVVSEGARERESLCV